MKKQMHNPTMMIKSKFSNQIHKLLNFTAGHKKYSFEWWELQQERKNKPLTEKQKAELFDQIEKIYNKCSEELRNYFEDRSYKKFIHKKRVERGATSKKNKKYLESHK